MKIISHFLYVSIKTDICVFADEIDKQHLLGSVYTQVRDGTAAWRVAAFLLMDNEFDLLIACLDEADWLRREELARLVNDYLAYYRQQTGRLNEHPALQIDMQVLSDARSVIECCLFLHTLPADLHLCDKACDYWWSSYITYRDEYDWKCVSPSCIYDLISPNRIPARKTFLQLHHTDQLASIKNSSTFMDIKGN